MTAKRSRDHEDHLPFPDAEALLQRYERIGTRRLPRQPPRRGFPVHYRQDFRGNVARPRVGSLMCGRPGQGAWAGLSRSDANRGVRNPGISGTHSRAGAQSSGDNASRRSRNDRCPVCPKQRRSGTLDSHSAPPARVILSASTTQPPPIARYRLIIACNCT